jgi:hypothetical protein
MVQGKGRGYPGGIRSGASGRTAHGPGHGRIQGAREGDGGIEGITAALMRRVSSAEARSVWAAAGVTVALASAIVKRSRGAACRDRLSIPSVKFSILILILV